MARPIKSGLDYFSFDVDFFEDEKIEAISGEFGIKGEVSVIKLLCAIYRNGYFIEWTEMLKMKLLKNLPGVSKELLSEIVSRLVRWGFFNEDLFNSENILTSKGIQKRYFEASKRRKNNKCKQYWLLNVVNVNINSINVDINTQSKVSNNNNNKILANADFFERSLLDTIWLESIAIKHKTINIETVKKYLSLFKNHLITQKNRNHNNYNEYCSHFDNWMQKQNIQVSIPKKNIRYY